MPEACRVFGTSLALYTMNHYVALFLWRLVGFVVQQHCGLESTKRRNPGMGSVTGLDMTINDMSLLLSSDGYYSDFGAAA